MAHAPLEGPQIEAVSGKTDSLVIISHGYGANGDDLIELGRQWSQSFPNTTFLAPNAPEPCSIAPMGRQWFPLSHNPGGFRSPDEYWYGVKNSEKVLNEFIDRKLDHYGLDESACALIGFSQGTMMSLHVGLRRNKQLAGIIGYSGVLAGSDHLEEEIQTKPPVLLVHGDADPVVPVEALQLARQALASVDIDAEWHIASMIGHTIDPLGFLLGQNFLDRFLRR